MSKIIVVAGPTASGKTALSIHLAKKYNAEVINADAQQVYKDVNIGTAKITKEEMENVKHHLLDFIPLDKNYSVKEYQEDGRNVLNNLINKNKNIVIVGGTGLYIKALLYDYKFSKETSSLDFSNLTNEELKKEIDKIYENNNIHINNRKRLERFLSHYKTTGNIIKNTLEKDKPLYDFTLIYLNPDREELYKKINTRVDKMINEGLLNETENLKEYSKLNSIIGYKELLEYINGKVSLEEAIENIKSDTRKYAKRQNTFFKNQFDNLNIFKIDYDNFNNTIKKVEDYLSSLYKE